MSTGTPAADDCRIPRWLSAVTIYCILFASPAAVAAPEEKACGFFTLQTEDASGGSTGENVASRIAVRDKKGELVLPVLTAQGALVTMCSTGAFLILDTNTEYAPGPSFLVSLPDLKILRFNFGMVREFQVGPDEDFFWVQSTVIDRGNRKMVSWKTVLHAVDRSGVEFFSKEYLHATKENLRVGARQYDIEILEPASPY